MIKTTIRPLHAALLTLVFAAGVSAQTPGGQAAPAPAAGPDFSKVEVKTTKIGTNFYTLEGQGGTIGILVGGDGVLIVDSQFAPLTDKIVAAIHQVTEARPRFLVNTHVHGDHTGGNENLARTGVTILARDELRGRLAKPNPGANGAPGTPAPPLALPMITYSGPVTIHMDGEDVQLIPVPSAHTDGDTMVKFPGVDVIMSGDFYRSTGYPNIDRANGGTLKGIVAGLNALINAAGPNTKIVPGHGVIVDRTAVTAHRDMILAIQEKVSKLMQQGMTAEQVTAAKPTSDYDAKVPGVGNTGDRFVGQLYAELKGTR
jgi:cyclase